ncbi:MAG TPA: thiamine-phosphate kinase [Burkholderiaceae bacterium]|nr:thiamine-phosphate kinase [Burkholderiaceae bacterium]
MNEFELIGRYFTRPVSEHRGIGDDCALLAAGITDLAVTTDMLVEDVHFLPGADPRRLGHKALAVNLSDLAATGAAPRAYFLSLALPRADPDWLERFAAGMFALAERHGCELLGGDTVRAPRWRGADGPLTISITALGNVEPHQALGRGGARPGDDIWVSGTLGDAFLGLLVARGDVHVQAHDAEHFRERMDCPTPRVELGRALRGVASAAIDVSDGLAGDLGHVIARSGVGARVKVAALPRSAALARQPRDLQRRAVLGGGDDYELLFTASAREREPLERVAQQLGVPLARVGEITEAPAIAWLDENGRPFDPGIAGFDHFAPPLPA